MAYSSVEAMYPSPLERGNMEVKFMALLAASAALGGVELHQGDAGTSFEKEESPG